jgi:hypothetical protein
MAKLTVLLPILFLIGVTFVSGCTQQTTYVCPDGTAVSNASLCPKQQVSHPNSELLLLTPGEIILDSFGNTYSVRGMGYGGIDIIVNDKVGYLQPGDDGNCILLYNLTNVGYRDCYSVPYVKVYLKVWDHNAQKATIEVVKR